MDIRLHAIEQGEGEPFVLLHGNGEDASYFQAQIQYFSQRYRVIAVDTRGHGQSPRGEGPFTLTRFADDLKAALDERGIKRIILLGFSDGGNIALLFALRYPEMVQRLILNGANLSPWGVKLGTQLPIVLEYGLVSLLALGSRRARRKKEILGLMVREPHISPQQLSQIQAPTLVLAGTKDMIRTKHTKSIAEAIPDSRLVLVPGDHFIAAKQSKEFHRAIDSFLGAAAVRLPSGNG